MLACSGNLNAYTAVTSGAWSNAATWGGIGPGSSVFSQDINIPTGITVDMDMDVTFNGLLNSFSVAGTLNNTAYHSLEISSGTFSGAGTVSIGKLAIGGLTSFYSFTGLLTADVFRNQGSLVNVTSIVTVYDTLDLESGATTIGNGGNVVMMWNSNVRVNSGSFANAGGTFTTSVPYDVWYVGGSKTTGEEINSDSVRHVHVMLSSNAQNLTLSKDLAINGDLHMMGGHVVIGANMLHLRGDLMRNPGAIFESGLTSDLTISGISGPLSSNLEFSSSSVLNELVIDRHSDAVHLGNDVTVVNRLELRSGGLWVEPGATLEMGTGSTVSRYIGWLSVDGTFDASQQYNVEYLGDSVSTGAELSGSGLNNLTINLWQSYRWLTLTQNITVAGDFMLLNGQFILDTCSARFDGTFHQESGMEISGSLNSRLTLSMATSVNDTLWIRLSGYQFKELVIDLPAASTITLNSDMFVSKLIFVSGKINVHNALLKVGTANPTIVGASDLSYVVTSGWGGLMIYVVADAPYTEFPIGTATNYAPAAIMQTSPGTTGNILVSVMDGVWTNGTSGTDVSASQSVVNKTWTVYSDSLSTVNMDVRLGWGVASEVNGFDRQQCYIKNYYNNTWDSDLPGMAQTGNNNTYQTQRTGMGNAGVFAVVDDLAPLSVPQNTVAGVAIYPNPTTDFLITEVSSENNGRFVYELFDASGRLVNSFSNAEVRNQIDFRTYELGSYTLRITNLSTQEVIVKPVIKS